MKEIKIDLNTAGGRLDRLLMAYLDKAPKGFVFKMLRKKNIVLNDKKAFGNEILHPGDLVKIYFSDETINKFHSEQKNDFDFKMALEFKKHICFEDDNIIVMNKPAGILSQKSVPDDVSMNELMLEYLKREAGFEGSKNNIGFKPGISNRLDRNTSGIMLAAKNPNAVRELNAAIKERRISKNYYCIVCGKILFNEPKAIEAFLSKDESENKSEILDVLPQNEKVQDNYEKITTVFETVSAGENCTLLNVGLITGKSHQIRAQADKSGFPIIGDPKYGDFLQNKKYGDLYGIKRQLLHAAEVEFNDMRGILEYLNNMRFISPLPDDFKTLMRGENIWLPGEAEG